MFLNVVNFYYDYQYFTGYVTVIMLFKQNKFFLKIQKLKSYLHKVEQILVVLREVKV